ncbi:hypothetical protein V2J09_012184 [Rumex salicifolius]
MLSSISTGVIMALQPKPSLFIIRKSAISTSTMICEDVHMERRDKKVTEQLLVLPEVRSFGSWGRIWIEAVDNWSVISSWLVTCNYAQNDTAGILL